MSSIIPSKCGIYRITCTANGKIYIGSTKDLDRRWNEHRWELRGQRHDNVHLQKAWNKYGENAFTIELIEECKLSELYQREQYYLDTLKPFKPIGYNMAIDAKASMKGRKMSKEAIEKTAIASRKRRLTDEQKAHLSRINTGKKLTPEHIEKVRLTSMGRRHTLESRAKLSEIHSQQIYILTSPTGEMIEVRNLKRFCLENDLKPSAMCRVVNGKNNHHHGWKGKLKNGD